MQELMTAQSPAGLLELAAGYQRSQVLFVLVEFALPELLSRRPRAAEEVAARLGLHPQAAESFLNACLALGLLERDGHVFRNAPVSDLYLVKGRPTYLGDEFMRYGRTSYPMWYGLADDLRRWRPGATDAELPPPEDQGRSAIRERHNLSLLVGRALAASFDFSPHRRMLDLGGGSCAMTVSICRAHPHLRSTIFELPRVAEEARAVALECGLAERVDVVEGDFKRDELPGGFDIALLANLLSVASEQSNRRLFKRIYDRLPPGGVILISGYILDDGCAGPVIPALFCLQDICWNAPDVERDAATYTSWLEEAGFVGAECFAYYPPTSLLVARKPRY